MSAHLRLARQDGRELARELGVAPPTDFDDSGRAGDRIAPGEPAWIVLGPAGDGAPRLALARFGFRHPERHSLLATARSETVHRLPAFRDAFVRRRCLVPVEGFYEWAPALGGRRLVLHRRADGGLLVLLGLQEEQLDERTGELRAAFTVLTIATSAEPRLSGRVPVVTTPDDPRLAAWLRPADAGAFSAPPLLALLRPPPEELLVVEAVPTRAPEPPVRLPRRPPGGEPASSLQPGTEAERRSARSRAGVPARRSRSLPRVVRPRAIQLELFPVERFPMERFPVEPSPAHPLP